MNLLDVPAGGYQSLPNGPPYSEGVIAATGYRIDQVVLDEALPVEEGFAAIDSFLAAQERPAAALCGVELRSSRAGSFGSFDAFNDRYRHMLDVRGLIIDGVNPIARTNVVPTTSLPEPSLVGFSYATPAAHPDPTFVVAGAAELRGGALAESAVVRPGEEGPAALEEKAAHVVGTMVARVRALGQDPSSVATVRVYSLLKLHTSVHARVLDAFSRARIHGVVRYHASPPVEGLVFEMDVRRVAAVAHVRL